MKSLKEGTKAGTGNGIVQGYWMYKDGHSYWGAGLRRNSEVPVSTTKEMHAEVLEEKIKWYKEETEKAE